jgi:hypothetical protein
METVESSPYQSPAPPPLSPPPMYSPVEREPQSVKVFAVIHLVFSGIGFLWGLYLAIAPLFTRAMLEGFSRSAPAEQRATFEASMAMQEKTGWVGVLSGVFMLILAVMLLTSGIKLLRRRANGLAWSNVYAWTSISTKLISLVLTALYILPAQREMMQIQFQNMPGGAPSGLGAAGQTFGTAAGIFTLVCIVLGCTYPILSLCLLNKPEVKSWLGVK